MATGQKRGPYQWRVQILKKGFPPQTRTFDVRSEADAWARQVEGEMDRGLFVSRKEAENTTLSVERSGPCLELEAEGTGPGPPRSHTGVGGK